MTPDPALIQHCQLESHAHSTSKCSDECQMQEGKPRYDMLVGMVYTVEHSDDCLFLCTHIDGLAACRLDGGLWCQPQSVVYSNIRCPT